MLSKEEFYIKRTPVELSDYVDTTYLFINNSEELKKKARLKREPFKTFLEELIPFSKFCSWKYNHREDILCSLVPGTTGRDAIISFCNSKVEHSLEITWAIDGRKNAQTSKQINERGFSDVEIWSGIEKIYDEINRTIEGAKRKSNKDYRFLGGSTLLIVFEPKPYFGDDNLEHVRLIKELAEKLKSINYFVDNVYLLLLPDKFIQIKEN